MIGVMREGLSLRHIETAFVSATVFLAPMNYFRLDAVYVTLADLTALCTLGVMLMRGSVKPDFFGEITGWWITGYLMCMGGMFVSSLLNGVPEAGLIVIGQYSVSMIMLPLIIAGRTFEELINLLIVFVVSITLIMVHGAYVVNYTPGDLRFLSYNGRLRSLIERTNEAAALVAMAITFLQWLLYVRRIPILAFAVMMPILCYGLLLTGSNTGFALAMIGTVCLALVSGSFRIVLGIVVVGVVLGAVTLTWGEYFLPEIFIERVFGALQTGDVTEAGTFTGRMELIRESLVIAQHTVFVGLGVDQYRVVSPHGAPVHNTYLLILTEGGLVSLLGLLWMLFAGLFLGAMAMRSRRTAWVGALTATTIVMFALAYNGLTHVYARFWAVPLILAIGLSASGGTRTSENVVA